MAIHQVISINKDTMESLERRGVSLRDVDVLCDMAIREAMRKKHGV